MLTRRGSRGARRSTLPALVGDPARTVTDRRGFLRRAGLAASGLAGLGAIPLGGMRRAAAIAGPKPGVAVEIRKNVCTHCSVGCTVHAEVQNGIWTGQEPAWGSPINRGTHCAKGAAIREVVHSE